MSTPFTFSKLTLVLLTLPLASLSHSAGIDRSGQDISAFLQDGTYAETVYTYINADISGVDKANNKTGDIFKTYDFFRYGVKTDIDDTFSVGVLYDEPFGAEAGYKGESNFVSSSTSQTAGEGTDVSLRTYNLTGILGAKIGAAKNVQVYAGPVYQKAAAELEIRGDAYGPFDGYDATLSSDNAMGWLAGFAYSKPEKALKAALTYRSEIEHEMDSNEVFSGNDFQTQIDLTTPESVNFDFQTGLNRTTLATVNVRYVPWSDFAIVPPKYTSITKGPLIAYSDDQWKVDLGLAKRVADNLAISGTVGWDSGAGNPVSSLGPIEGYYSVGLGAKYNMNKNWAISAGGKYLKFGDAKGALSSGTIVSNFEDNDGFALGVKLSYQDK